MSAKKTSNKRQSAKLKDKKAKEFPRVAEALERPLGKAASADTAAASAESKRRIRKSTREKPKKVSALDAAAKVLAEKGEPMNCQEMIAAMADKGYWKSATSLLSGASA